MFVCTGNRARSPLAAALLRQWAPEHIRVRSVGVLEQGPVPAVEAAIRIAREVGVDLSAHRARSLQRGELATADLVIGFEPEHVSTAVVDGRARLERTFSLIELSTVLAEIARWRGGEDDSGALVELAHAHRPTGFLLAPAIADPFGRSDVVFRETTRAIEAHVATIARILFPRVASGA